MISANNNSYEAIFTSLICKQQGQDCVISELATVKENYERYEYTMKL